MALMMAGSSPSVIPVDMELMDPILSVFGYRLICLDRFLSISKVGTASEFDVVVHGSRNGGVGFRRWPLWVARVGADEITGDGLILKRPTPSSSPSVNRERSLSIWIAIEGIPVDDCPFT